MEAILLQVILIGLNAVFASAEIAVISMNDTKLERNAKSDAAGLKLLRFRLIFGAECDILRLRKRLRNLRETSRSSFPRKEAIRCRP